METKKLILIPESRPLYAMQRRLLISRGPIMKPTPVPVSVIGELLRQSGNEKVTIYEVIPQGNRYSKEVELTLDNYTLPYDEILNGVTPEAAVEQSPLQVEPVIVEPVIGHVEQTDSKFEEVEQTVVELTPDTAPDGLKVLDDPYAGMTRKQRKAAMRAARREEQTAETTITEE